MITLDVLFTAGLGLDIAGAALLAKGLLVSPAAHLNRSRSYWDYSPPAILGLAEDWVAAVFGVASLLTGFSMQAVGYCLVIAGFDTQRGTAQALVALVFAIAAAAASFGVWRTVRARMIRARVVAMATAASPSGVPDGEVLVKVGQEMGHFGLVTNGRLETADDYARRVFGVERIAVADSKTLLMMMHSGTPSVGPH